MTKKTPAETIPLFPKLNSPRDLVTEANDPRLDRVPLVIERTVLIVLNSEEIPDAASKQIINSVQSGRIVFAHIYVPSYNAIGRPENYGYCLMVWSTATGSIRYTILSQFDGDVGSVVEAEHSHSNFNEIQRYWDDVVELYKTAIALTRTT